MKREVGPVQRGFYRPETAGCSVRYRQVQCHGEADTIYPVIKALGKMHLLQTSEIIIIYSQDIMLDDNSIRLSPFHS